MGLFLGAGSVNVSRAIVNRAYKPYPNEIQRKRLWTCPRTHLGDAQPHITVRVVVVETKPDLLRLVGVEEEVLVAEGRAARRYRAVVIAVVVDVQRVGPLIPLVEGDPHPDNILGLVEVVVDPAPLVVVVEDVALARPARVGVATVVARVLGFAAVRGAPRRG